MLANGDRGSIPGQVIPKTQKVVLDTSLLMTQHYNVRIKGKVEQSRERRRAIPVHFGVVAIEKGVFGCPRLLYIERDLGVSHRRTGIYGKKCDLTLPKDLEL